MFFKTSKTAAKAWPEGYRQFKLFLKKKKKKIKMTNIECKKYICSVCKKEFCELDANEAADHVRFSHTYAFLDFVDEFLDSKVKEKKDKNE